jgi:hypothetical protein
MSVSTRSKINRIFCGGGGDGARGGITLIVYFLGAKELENSNGGALRSNIEKINIH